MLNEKFKFKVHDPNSVIFYYAAVYVSTGEWTSDLNLHSRKSNSEAIIDRIDKFFTFINNLNIKSYVKRVWRVSKLVLSKDELFFNEDRPLENDFKIVLDSIDLLYERNDLICGENISIASCAKNTNLEYINTLEFLNESLLDYFDCIDRLNGDFTDYFANSMQSFNI